MVYLIKFSTLLCFSFLVFQKALFSQHESNYVDSELYEYSSDGFWCWFQDERAVVDSVKEKLVIGTANMKNGIDCIIFDIKTKRIENTKRFTLSGYYSDDHNAPGMCIAPNGNYLALWNHHYDKHNTRYSIYNGQSWSPEKQFDWNTIPGGTNYTICYSNVYSLSAEKLIYNFARANNRAPNFIVSDDNGGTWKFGGQITTNRQGGYNKGYYKYWGNGVDRIDIVLNEKHPREGRKETGTSIYHGYIKDRKMHDSKGKVLDSDINDRSKMPTDNDFTKVFANGTKVNGVAMYRCWQHDIVRYDDGTVAILFKARANDNQMDHRNFFSRFDGNTWKTTYIGKAGWKIYSSEEDYTGLGALCPDNPNRIYISSPFNPGDDNSKEGKREIWRGISDNNGNTWKWEAVTANSTMDNFRPIVPKWKPGKEALLWFRGTYTTAQIINAKVVGTFYDHTATGIGTEKGNTMLMPHEFSMVNSPGKHQIAIHYTVSKRSLVEVGVYNLRGMKISTLSNQLIFSGSNILIWDTSNLSAGIYIIRITIGKNSFNQRVTIQK
jgi:hypothetical protein